MEVVEDGSETRSLRRRSAAATPSGTSTAAAGADIPRRKSIVTDDKEPVIILRDCKFQQGTPPPGMKTRTRTSLGTPPSGKPTRTMVTRERKESPAVDDGGVIYKSRIVTSRKRSLTETSDSGSTVEVPDSPPKKRRTVKATENGEEEKDYYCWLCHKDGENMISCELCPRAFHSKCLGIVPASEDWVCPECEKVMCAECVDTQSKAMKKLSLDQLCMVLNFAVSRLKHSQSKPFQKAVDHSHVPTYKDYIVHPMDIDQIEQNIKQKLYGSTEAFLADVKWILHNCIIFNGVGGKLTSAAKLILKIAKHETSEVEICPECYLNSYLKKNNNWFCEPCKPPHTLIWAKLKGYPFWPAKALREVNGQVDVRFFGAHDRSWVPVSQVYLLSKEPPVPVKMKKWGFDESMEELRMHINRIRSKFGAFHYSAFRVPYDPQDPFSPEKYRPGKIEIEGSPGRSSDRKVALKSPPVTTKKFFSKTPLAKRTYKQALMMKTTTKAISNLKNKYSSLASSRRARLSKNVSAGSDKSESEIAQNNETDDDTPIGDQLETLFGKNEDTDSIADGGEGDEKEEVETAEENEKCEKETSTLIVEAKPHEEILIKTKPDPVHESDPDEEISAPAHSPKKSDENTRDRDSSEVKKTGENTTNVINTKELSSSINVPKKVQMGKSAADEIQEKVSQIQTTEEKDSDEKTESRDSSSLVNEKSNARNENTKSDSNLDQSVSETLQNVDSFVDSIDEDKAYNTESDSDLAALRSFSLAVNEASDTEPAKPSEKSKTDSNPASTSEGSSKEPLNNNSIVKDSSAKPNGNKPSKIDSSETTESDVQKASKSKGNESAETDLPAQTEGESKIPAVVPGTPKKNPFLENLVESCKAKLGVNEEELKSDVEDEEMVDDKDESEEDEEEAESATDSDAPSTSDDDGKGSGDGTSPVEMSGSGKGRKRRRSASDILQDLLKKSVETVKARRSSNVSGESSVSSKSSEKTTEVGSAKRKQPKAHIQDIREKKKLEKEREWRERQLQRKREEYEESKRKEVDERRRESGESQVRTPSRGSGGKTPNTDTGYSPTEADAPSEPNTAQPIDLGASPRGTAVSPASQAGEKPSPSREENRTPAGDQAERDAEREKLRANFVEQVVGASSGSFAFDKYLEKAMSNVKGVMVDMYKDLVSTEANKAVSRHLQLELERMQWRHAQELQEMKHNFDLVLSEQRMLLEHERQQQIENLKKSFMKEREEIIKETKKKQWCAYCGKEAMFYCCWNTSYCDYPCQQSHWPKHMSTCTQNTANVSSGIGAGGGGVGQESSEADSTVNEQNALRQYTAGQLKRQELERPSSMGQASGPSPVHFMQGSPQMMSGPSFNPIRMHNIATYQTPQQLRFGAQSMIQPSPMMQQNSQPIVYSLVRPPPRPGPPGMQNPQQPVLISRPPGMQGQVIRNPFGYQPGPPSF